MTLCLLMKGFFGQLAEPSVEPEMRKLRTWTHSRRIKVSADRYDATHMGYVNR